MPCHPDRVRRNYDPPVGQRLCWYCFEIKPEDKGEVPYPGANPNEDWICDECLTKASKKW